MYVSKGNTNFSVGYINDEFIITFESDFNYPNNVKLKDLSVPTFYDKMTKQYLYEYNNCLCNLNELRMKYLVEYYSVLD